MFSLVMKLLFVLLLMRTNAEFLHDSLVKNIAYLVKNPMKCNVDCLLGLEFAMDDEFKVDLMDLSRYLRAVLKNSTNEWLVEYVIEENVWKKVVRFDKHVEYLKMQENVMENGPTSDYCLRNIVNETMGNEWRFCRLNDDCINTFFNPNRLYSGYWLTHQLLLFQVAKGRKCILNKLKYAKVVKKICSKIFLESVTIFSQKKFHLFDLFLEQILLCGYEGFVEFLNPAFLEVILNSQKPSGCFSINGRMKRNYNVYSDGCTDHTTGLGVAVLSMFYNHLKHYL